MTIFINPGSGPVAEATVENAAFNMGAFTADVMLSRRDGIYPSVERDEASDSEGRFAWVLRFGKQAITVEMPGIPLAQVRYLGDAGQNIWHFPRLYVNGSSWVWCYALDACDPSEEEDVD